MHCGVREGDWCVVGTNVSNCSNDYLILNSSPLGDAGLTALLPALCGLPKLVYLDLICTDMGDEGLASLVAQPTARALKSLEVLYLFDNQITDAGCATLASALRGGALPALKVLDLDENPASKQAQATVQAALSARSGRAVIAGRHCVVKGVPASRLCFSFATKTWFRRLTQIQIQIDTDM